jgi:hypothetical protein
MALILHARQWRTITKKGDFRSSMYNTCIFCSSSLGANEILERFPVGRRVAYDQATGRLWAVCQACERWNLSPLETRWEAIEDAERLFRATPLKVAGENIGLAQTTEGLEVVRIGAPPKLEMAAWRYGDQFGRRHRRRLVVGSALGIGFSGPIGMAALTIAGVTPPVALSLGVSLASIATSATLGLWIRRGKPRFFLRNQEGALLRLTNQDARLAVLIPEPNFGWRLELSHDVLVGGRTGKSAERVTVRGDAAHRALSRLMPFLNAGIGSRRELDGAVGVIGDVRNLDGLLRLAASNKEALKTHFKLEPGESNVSVLPARIRLALEMTLHEDDERRAMEGQLAELEARWREADALAKIADSLFLPDSVERELKELRER